MGVLAVPYTVLYVGASRTGAAGHAGLSSPGPKVEFLREAFLKRHKRYNCGTGSSCQRHSHSNNFSGGDFFLHVDFERLNTASIQEAGKGFQLSIFSVTGFPGIPKQLLISLITYFRAIQRGQSRASIFKQQLGFPVLRSGTQILLQ